MRGMTATLLVIGMMSPALAAEAPQSDIADLTAFADAFEAAQIAQDRAAPDRMDDHALVFLDGSGKRSGKAFFLTGSVGRASGRKRVCSYASLSGLAVQLTKQT